MCVFVCDSCSICPLLTPHPSFPYFRAFTYLKQLCVAGRLLRAEMIRLAFLNSNPTYERTSSESGTPRLITRWNTLKSVEKHAKGNPEEQRLPPDIPSRKKLLQLLATHVGLEGSSGKPRTIFTMGQEDLNDVANDPLVRFRLLCALRKSFCVQ